MRRPMRFLSCFFIFLSAAVGMATLAGVLLSLDRLPYLLRIPAEAESCTKTLLNSICTGDYETASEQLVGTPDFGLDSLEDNAKLLWDAYRGSCSYELSGTPYAAEDGLAQDVLFRTMDLEAVLADAKELYAPLLSAEAEASESAYGEDGNIRDELIQSALQKALQQALEQEDSEKQTSLTLQLVYSEGHWKVKPTDDLLSVICGGVIA